MPSPPNGFVTSMPETVALFNGCGGMSSLLVALAAALYPAALDASGPVAVVSIVVSVFVGAITFTGSIVAMAKLRGWLSTDWMQSKARHAVNIALAVASLVGAVEMLRNADSGTGLWLLVVASGLLGIGHLADRRCRYATGDFVAEQLLRCGGSSSRFRRGQPVVDRGWSHGWCGRPHLDSGDVRRNEPFLCLFCLVVPLEPPPLVAAAANTPTSRAAAPRSVRSP